MIAPASRADRCTSAPVQGGRGVKCEGLLCGTKLQPGRCTNRHGIKARRAAVPAPDRPGGLALWQPKRIDATEDDLAAIKCL